jgi:hypothetical protein
MTKNMDPDSKNSVLRTGAAKSARAIISSCGTSREFATSSASTLEPAVPASGLSLFMRLPQAL